MHSEKAEEYFASLTNIIPSDSPAADVVDLTQDNEDKMDVETPPPPPKKQRGYELRRTPRGELNPHTCQWHYLSNRGTPLPPAPWPPGGTVIDEVD